MYRHIKVRVFACVLIQFLFFIAVSSAETREGAEYAFVEMKSGNQVVLSTSSNSFIYGEIASKAKFCELQSSFYCFATKDFEFYVPKNIDGQRQWQHGNRVYCVVQSSADIYQDRQLVHNGSKYASRLYLIFSSPNGDCRHAGQYDVRAMYSTSTGLKSIMVRTDRANMELFSLDRVGFGARQDTK